MYRWDQPAFPNNYWSVTWDGQITPPISGEYTFYLRHDGKVTFVLGNDTLLDGSVSDNEWRYVDTVKVYLEGGIPLSTLMEYDHYDYVSRIELEWEYSIVLRTKVIIEKIGIDTHSGDEGSFIEVYPNPVQDKLIFDMELYQGVKKISIYSSSGQLVLERLDKGEGLDISSLSTGFYLLEVLTDSNDVFRESFIKE